MESLVRLVPRRLKSRVKRRLGVPDQESTLRRMKRLGFAPRTVVDIGAHAGHWTRMCKRVFPEAQILMLEPQQEFEPALRSLAGATSGVEFAMALLGEKRAESVTFHGIGSNASVLREHGHPPAYSRTLPMQTLADLVEGTKYDRPQLMKLDVQGYELEVLRGAEAALRTTEALLLEVALIAIYEDSPLFVDVVEFLRERGFRLYDICGLIRRPRDRALWQVDAMFVHCSSRLVASRAWA